MWTPRNIAGTIACAALVAFGIYFNHVRDKAKLYDATIVQLERERATFEAWKRDREKSDEASTAYQSELAGLRADIQRRPAPIVRVCPQPPAAPAAAIVQPAPGPDAGAPATRSVSPGAGVSEPGGTDIGPYLDQLSTRSDELSAQLRAILNRARE